MRRAMIAIPILCVCAVGIASVLLWRHFAADPRPDIPENAALVGLDWTQGGSAAEDCFSFRMRQSGGRYVLSGRCVDPDSFAPIEREVLPLSAEQWQAVERCLRENPHRAPVTLPEGAELLDADTSALTVEWRCAEGEKRSAAYDGRYESTLRGILVGFLTGNAE